MNRVSLKIGVIATVAALSTFLFSTAGVATATQPLGKNGVIYACFKAKGKNKGALRVVASKRGCKKLRGGWRPVSWSANGSSGASGQSGTQGSAGTSGERGPQGNPGPEGKEGEQGLTGTVEESLVETIQTQTTQIHDLTQQVTGLSGELLGLEADLNTQVTSLTNEVTGLTNEVLGLEDTVKSACTQLSALTDQSDELIGKVGGIELLGGLGVLKIPTLPALLGSFECD